MSKISHGGKAAPARVWPVTTNAPLPNNTDNHDNDPSPAGGAMPVPAIYKADGPANDNAFPVPVNDNAIPPVHPYLPRYGVGCDDDDVTLEIERLELGGIPHPIETVGGKIVNLPGLASAKALARLGRKIETVEIPVPGNMIEHILRSIPIHRNENSRGCSAVLAKDDSLKLGRAKMAEAGKRGAAIRHGKLPKGSAKTPKPKEPAEVWFERAARILQIKPYTIKILDRIRRNAPDMFEMIRKGIITHLGDAVALMGRFESAEDRLRCFTDWKAKNGGQRNMKLSSTFTFFNRKRRRALRAVGNLPKGINLYHGDSSVVGKDKIADGSIDLVYADVVYRDLGHARAVVRLAKRVLRDGGYLVIINGNVGNIPTLDAVMAEGEGWIRECPQGTVHYHNARGGCPGVKVVDACPVFVFSKGEPDHDIKHLHFESGNADQVHHVWQKSVEPTMEILRAFTAHAEGERPPRVLDPCTGWGTTGVACVRLGFEFVGIEREQDRYKIAMGDILKAARDKAKGGS